MIASLRLMPSLAACTLLFAGPLTGHAATDSLPLTDVFVGGQDGYPAYRIPALVTSARGTLLAFAEGRANLRDHAENDIVLKRSTDGGRTWEPLQIIHEDGTNALNNPTAVCLRETGQILLMYQWYPRGFDEHKAEPGYEGPRVCRTFLTRSSDDGLTWARPVDITRQVKPPTVATSTATGPGIGIQLARGPHAGRVLMPFNHGPYGQWKAYAVFSDNQGQSWERGQPAPEGTPGYANEVQFVELRDGSLLLNARNQGGDKLRKTAVSRDGGRTWSPTRTDPALIEPVCQASVLRHPDPLDPGQDVVLFSNPATTKERRQGTIRLSRDDGQTWPVSRVLYEGSFGYSCLASLANGRAGCLFERDGSNRISFARFTLGWVEGRVDQ